MKRIAFLILLLSVIHEVCGQGAFTNNTNSSLQKVLEDYPQAFNNIRGDVLLVSPESKDFKSLINIPGAIRASVTQVSSGNQQNTSWNCLLFATAGFVEASGKFREFYNEIRNSIIKIGGQKPYILNGAYSSPRETATSHMIPFQLLPASGDLQKVKIELHLFSVDNEWKIALLVHDHTDRSLLVYRSGSD